MPVTFVFLVSSYQHPEQILRLVRLLRSACPSARLILRHDVRGCDLPLPALRAIDVEVTLSPFPIVWGDFSQTASLLEVMAGLVLEETDVVVHLSSSDYPIRPLAEFQSMLEASPATAFLSLDSENSSPDHVLQRYHRVSYTLPLLTARPGSVAGRSIRATARRLQRLPGCFLYPQPHGLPERFDRPRLRSIKQRGFSIHVGSEYFALRKTAVDQVLATARDTALCRLLARTYIPGEAFWHTALFNSELEVESRALHYIKWSPGAAHPSTLNATDFVEMSASSSYFARKFAPDDAILDLLDHKVL